MILVCKEVHRDRYERTVSLCAIGGVDLSLAMIRAGRQWRGAPICVDTGAICYRVSEAKGEAKAAKRGMWSRPVEPWRDWRC